MMRMTPTDLIEIGLVSVGFGIIGSVLTLRLAVPLLIARGKAEIDVFIEEYLEEMEKEPELVARVLQPFVKYLNESNVLPDLAKKMVPVIFKEIGLDSNGQMKDLKIGPIKIPGHIAAQGASVLIEKFAGPKKAVDEVAKVIGFG